MLMSPLSLTARALVAGSFFGLASAQSVTFSNPTSPTVSGFGAGAAIVSDADNLGRRDVVVLLKNPVGSELDLMSSDTGSRIVFTPPVFSPFDAVVNVGNIDTDNRNDVATVENAGGGNLFVTVYSGSSLAFLHLSAFIVGPPAIDAMATLG